MTEKRRKNEIWFIVLSGLGAVSLVLLAGVSTLVLREMNAMSTRMENIDDKLQTIVTSINDVKTTAKVNNALIVETKQRTENNARLIEEHQKAGNSLHHSH